MSDRDKTFTYGHGYVNLSGRFRAVMAYNDQCAANGFNCTRAVHVESQSTSTDFLGTAQNDPIPASNVARVLNETAFTVANFRQAVVGQLRRQPGVRKFCRCCVDGLSHRIIGSGLRMDSDEQSSSVITSSASGAAMVASTTALPQFRSGAAERSRSPVLRLRSMASACVALGATASTWSNANNASTTVTAATGCAWTAMLRCLAYCYVRGQRFGPAWLASPLQNSGGARISTLTIAGQTAPSIRSATGYSISATSVNFDEQNAGGAGWLKPSHSPTRARRR